VSRCSKGDFRLFDSISVPNQLVWSVRFGESQGFGGFDQNAARQVECGSGGCYWHQRPWNSWWEFPLSLCSRVSRGLVYSSTHSEFSLNCVLFGAKILECLIAFNAGMELPIAVCSLKFHLLSLFLVSSRWASIVGSMNMSLKPRSTEMIFSHWKSLSTTWWQLTISKVRRVVEECTRTGTFCSNMRISNHGNGYTETHGRPMRVFIVLSCGGCCAGKGGSYCSLTCGSQVLRSRTVEGFRRTHALIDDTVNVATCTWIEFLSSLCFSVLLALRVDLWPFLIQLCCTPYQLTFKQSWRDSHRFKILVTEYYISTPKLWFRRPYNDPSVLMIWLDNLWPLFLNNMVGWSIQGMFFCLTGGGRRPLFSTLFEFEIDRSTNDLKVCIYNERGSSREGEMVGYCT